MTPAVATLLVGQTLTLVATPKDGSGTPLTGRVVAWSSSDPTKATVSAAGLVTARDSGLARIRATIEGKTDSAAATVRLVPVASVAMSSGGDTLDVGDSLRFTASVYDSVGHPLTGRSIAWTTSDLTKATVNATGLVKILDTGMVRVTATSEGQSTAAALLLPPCAGLSNLLTGDLSFRLGPGTLPPPSATVGNGYYQGVTGVLFGGGVVFGTSGSALVLGYDPVSGASDIGPSRVCTLDSSAVSKHTYAKLPLAQGVSGPPGLTVRQESYTSALAASEDLIVLRYTFTNTGAATLSNLTAGFVADWDLFFDGTALVDRVRYDAGQGAAEAIEGDSLTHPQIVGMIPLVSGGAGTLAFKGWVNGSDPAGRAGYFAALTAGADPTTAGQPGDVRGLTGVSGITLAPGQQLVVSFVIVVGANRAAFDANAATARAAVMATGP